jgi:hypothetical protein
MLLGLFEPRPKTFPDVGSPEVVCLSEALTVSLELLALGPEGHDRQWSSVDG